MNAREQWIQNTSDPLGLRGLEAVDPGYDGWKQVESALVTHQQGRLKWRRRGGWLATAASLALVLGFTLQYNRESTSPLPGNEFATSGQEVASVQVKDNVSDLIGLSQRIEQQVKTLRQDTGSMPAESAVYVAELEDLIAQVDRELSLEPGSLDLWGQRVNLMLDLAQIYQQQWQIDYGRMASL
jgi:hypothetical protein